MEQKIKELLTRGVVNIIPNEKSLDELLHTGNKLNIYLGIDPTATKIHLGHAVPLRKLKLFSELGHNVIFLIGDFTALIGDTSDKDTERPRLTTEEIKTNFVSYQEQAEKILDFSKVKIVYNSQWLKNLKFEDIVKLCQHFSVGEFVGRELIKKRLSDGKPVGLHETLYPVMQGYDSFHLDTDVQVGAADQTFNMQAGRTLLKDLSEKESFVLVTAYLTGTDGRKMSKSWGNAIWLNDSATEMFGKVMSLKDDLIIEYFTLATSTPTSEIENHKRMLDEGQNPRDVKIILAETIVSEIHGKTIASEARKHFEKTFQDKTPTFTPLSLPMSSLATVAGTVSSALNTSMSDAKRMVSQGSVDINGHTVENPKQEVHIGDKIKIGKRDFFEINSNENNN